MREVNHKVSKEEMVARVSQMYSGKVKVKKCPKAHLLKRPANAVRSWDRPFRHFTLLVCCVGHINFLVVYLQECELQMWCPAPLPDGEPHRRKLRSDKYKHPAGHLLEFYESDSSVEADKDTGNEARGGNAETGPDAGGAAKPRRRTRSAVGKQSALAVDAAISVVKAAEKKNKRKRKATSPPEVMMPTIPTPQSRVVESEEEEESGKEKDEAMEKLPVTEDRLARRSESPAAKRQRELVEKTSEDALRRGLKVQRVATATQARMPAGIKLGYSGPSFTSRSMQGNILKTQFLFLAIKFPY
jgi:hypothetical protein